MKAGDIYTVNLDPTIGDEIRKLRPVVILNGGHDKHLKQAIVAPMTQWQPRWDEHPFFVALAPDNNNRLEKKSMVDCFHIRAVSHQRFVNRVGAIAEIELVQIKQALSLILDIDPEHCQ